MRLAHRLRLLWEPRNSGNSANGAPCGGVTSGANANAARQGLGEQHAHHVASAGNHRALQLLRAGLGSNASCVPGVVDEDHETGGYTCRPWMLAQEGYLEDLIRSRLHENDYDPNENDLTTDQILFYLEHCVPWDE